MSFAVSRDRGLYEWAGTSLGALFAQRRNLINPGQWRMVWDILRFNSASLFELRDGDKGESIGAFIEREGYSDAFRDNYLLVRFRISSTLTLLLSSALTSTDTSPLHLIANDSSHLVDSS